MYVYIIKKQLTKKKNPKTRTRHNGYEVLELLWMSQQLKEMISKIVN